MKRAVLVGAIMAAAAAPAAAQQCALEYQRADNMFAAHGRPDGQLGKETLVLEPGHMKVFTTDWKYEKQRNDGSNYYGSHVRIVRNTGKRVVKLVFRGDISSILGGAAAAAAVALKKVSNDRASGTLDPGASWNVRADLMEVSCQSADKEAKIAPPNGLAARQTSPREIILTWQKVADAKEYRVYVNPPPAPHLAGRPGLAGGNSTRWVVILPPSVAPATVYRASIETVGMNGATSERAEFNPVAVQAASGPGGTPQGGGGAGSPAGGTPASLGGQRCPAGEFVTGIDDGGRIVCVRP